MTKHASSSDPQQKTPDNKIPTSKGASSMSAKRELDAWVEANAKELIKAMINWKRADRAPDVRPGTATHYNAREGTEKDLRHNLGLIYKEHGPLHMHYGGCDNLARHWVSGWHVDVKLTPVQKVIMCVHMKELLPGQSPVLEKLAPHRVVQTPVIHTHSSDEDEDYVKSEAESEEPDEDHEVWSGEEITENEAVWSVEESEEEDGGKNEDKSGWVDVPSGGVDDDDGTKPHDGPSVV